jgi:hypothetical protein
VCTFLDVASHIHHSDEMSTCRFICNLICSLSWGFACHSHGSLLPASSDCWRAACCSSGSYMGLCQFVFALAHFGLIYFVMHLSVECMSAQGFPHAQLCCDLMGMGSSSQLISHVCRRLMCDYNGPVWSSSTEPPHSFDHLKCSFIDDEF